MLNSGRLIFGIPFLHSFPTNVDEFVKHVGYNVVYVSERLFATRWKLKILVGLKMFQM